MLRILKIPFLVQFILLLSFNTLAWAQNSVLILDNVEQAAQGRIELLNQANEKINAQYFIYGKDAISLSGLALVARAKIEKPNLKVQILIDAAFNHIPKSVGSYLASIGVDIREYHPFNLLHPTWIVRRMHDKGISIDGSQLITGGRNVENSYFGYSRGRNYVDRDIYLVGNEVQEYDQYFEELFNSREVRKAKTSSDERLILEGKQMLEQAFKIAFNEGFIKNDPEGNWKAGTAPVSSVDFIHDTIGQKTEKGIAKKLANLFLEANERILIESPYLVPTNEFLEMVEIAKAKGVKITIHTNSVLSTDGYLPQGGYMRYRKKLLEMGVEIFEFKGPRSLHAKSMVIDKEIAVVGSYNLDPRSQYLNSEVALVVRDRATNKALEKSIRKNMRNAHRLNLQGLPANGDPDPKLKLTMFERLRIRIATCASYLIKNQL